MNAKVSNRQVEIETPKDQEPLHNNVSYISHWPLIADGIAEEAALSGWLQYHQGIIHYGELAEGCDFIRMNDARSRIFRLRRLHILALYTTRRITQS